MTVRYLGWSAFAARCSVYYFHRHLDSVNNFITVTQYLESIFALLPGLHQLNILLHLPPLHLAYSAGQYKNQREGMQLPVLYLEGEIHSRFHLEYYVTSYQGDNSMLLSLLSTNTGLHTICPTTHAQYSSQRFVPGSQCGLSKLDLEILNRFFIF